ncbi:hypothetical protein [Spirosoma montaniterrae]|uniref:Tetratricopeptide repeat protein n=1 Tax=Spirosoma montaniterrae TaxID=1178516 RepID=A0A1P9WS29_9BACT|nr:hypothetical protein [Spirosoma montaniterrae]AQG78150.1 hypothetical protein AWR27_01560 [Spirosoma montaniterrae]
MKTRIISLFVLCIAGTSLATWANPALRPTLAQMNAARTADQWQNVASQLSRLSDQSPNEWLPAYWATYAYITASFRAGDNADDLLDRAEPYYERVIRLQPQNDEVLVLQSYMAQARLAAKPMFRWMKYGPLSEKALQAARQKNPANPRIPLLEGLALYHKPATFGGGPASACPLLQQSVQKFATFKPTSDLHPNWGRDQIAPLLAKCK